MHQHSSQFQISTRGKGLYAFTDQVAAWLADTGLNQGLLTLFVQHTSASLLVQENADPDVQGDLERFLSRLVPENDPIYRHTLEGADDMPAHVRAALTQTHLSIPVAGGRMALGTWQGLYLFEHRREPQHRRVAAHLIGA
ncbi:MAG: YjbQ family protein [Hydrogenophilaceae bacterium]|nr:YjbQ family protein [Hydrogenophilaceae bacterium]